MTVIRNRRGTSAQWSSANPILSDGETGWDTTVKQFKMGNGVSTWNSLPYINETLASIKDFGAKGDGVTSDTAAINAALAADKAVIYPTGYYPNSVDGTFYLYEDMRNRSGGMKLQRGVPGNGTSDYMPVMQVDKTSNSQRVEGGVNYWDSAFYTNLTIEPTATAFGSAITGRVRNLSGGDGIAVTGSGQAVGKEGRAWGMWAYAANADDGSGIRSSSIIGLELNLNNNFTDQPRDGYLPVGEGPYRGIVIVTADFSAQCNIGLDIGAQVGSKGWWTGIRLRGNGIEPDGDTPETRSEQIDIQGATTSAKQYAGIRYSSGNFTYGMDFSGGSFSNFAAIKFDANDRIYYGPIANSNYFTYTGTLFDIRNMNIGMNGNKVMGARRTGWGLLSSFTGTKTRTGYDSATVTTPQLAERLSALIEDLLNHGLIGA